MTLALLLLCILCWSGCGVKSTSSTTSIEQPGPTSGTTATTPVLLTLSDDASSSALVSMYANISLVQITPRNGSAATLYTSSAPVELTHLAGTSQYLAVTPLAQDTYKNIIVTVNDPLITYIDSLGNTVTEEFSSFTGSAEIDFGDLVTVSSAPLEINLDFDLAKSVVLDPVKGTLTLTPTFTASALAITSGTPTIGTGLLEGVIGTVSNSNSGVLTLTTNVFQSNTAESAATQSNVSCNITGTTTAVNYTPSSGFVQGSLVRADMAAQTDGSIACTRIAVVNSSNAAFEMAGTINSYRGIHSPYQMTLAMQEGTGAGVSPNFIGSGINANFDTATFAVDWDGMDQANLGFTPVFSATNFFPGQYAEASSSVPLLTSGNDVGTVAGSMVTVAAMNSQLITLRKQNEEGTVSNVSTANGVTTFLLTLPATSVFAQYTANPLATTPVVPTINVVVPAGALVNGSLTTPVAGSLAGALPYVRVRGLLFLNGSAYTMVAQRVTAALAPAPVTTTTTTNQASTRSAK